MAHSWIFSAFWSWWWVSMTPLLIFLGIPAAVAVSTEANQIVASSVSGVIAHWRKKMLILKWVLFS